MRTATVLAVLLLCGGLHAEIINTHFQITLINWPANHSFEATVNALVPGEDPPPPPSGFDPILCPPGSVPDGSGGCVGLASGQKVPGDPEMIIDLLGESTPVPGLTFSFSAGPTGSAVLALENASGVAWNALEAVTAFPGWDFGPFTCGGDAFVNCGFLIEGDTLRIFFSGGVIDSAAIPEPGAWMLTLGGLGLLAVRRRKII